LKSSLEKAFSYFGSKALELGFSKAFSDFNDYFTTGLRKSKDKEIYIYDSVNIMLAKALHWFPDLTTVLLKRVTSKNGNFNFSVINIIISALYAKNISVKSHDIKLLSTPLLNLQIPIKIHLSQR
jgi:hypothetical protein